MDIFGKNWEDHSEKIKNNWISKVKENDTVIIPGDFSWAMYLNETYNDFEYLNNLPGNKIMLKGNHDYWWTTANKMLNFWNANGLCNFSLIHNNCQFYNWIALCGTRGWFFEEEADGHNEKVFKRELLRLETSLKVAGTAEKLCFLHYPPLYQGYVCQEIIDLLEYYKVKACYYGHLHGGSHRLAQEGRRGSVEYHLVAGDYVDFYPQKVLDADKIKKVL